jgi:hypothetical protein
VVLLGQHVELGSLGITSIWSPLYTSSGIPNWALYNKCFLQIHISTGPMDQIPALSQGILTSAYARTLRPVILESPGDHTGQSLRQVPLHLPFPFHPTVSRKQPDETPPLFPNSSWVLVSEGGLVGSKGSEDKNEPVPPSSMRVLSALYPIKGHAVSQAMALWGCLNMPQGR